MANWRNFYLRKVGTDGNGVAWPTYESVAQWGVWCREIPFKLSDKVKEPAKHTWHDEHGDDEYIPSSGLYLESYTMEVEFGCKVMKGVMDGNTAMPEVTNVRANVGNFLEYLRTSGMLMLYSTHTGIGRTNVRLSSYSEGKYVLEKKGDTVVSQFVTFKVTFKVNDPVTDVLLNNNGALVTVQVQE